MNMRLARSAGLAAFAMASLAGCSTRDDAAFEPIGQVSSLWMGSFTLRNYASGRCLGVAPDGTVVARTCDGSTNQTWTVGSAMTDSPGFYQLRDGAYSSGCLDNSAYQGSPPNYYYPLGISTCRTSGVPGYQPIFSFTSTSSGLDCFRFRWSVTYPIASSVVGTFGNLSNGARAVVSDDFNDVTNHPDQFWCVPRGSLYY